jgi:hypothetical protein
MKRPPPDRIRLLSTTSAATNPLLTVSKADKSQMTWSSDSTGPYVSINLSISATPGVGPGQTSKMVDPFRATVRHQSGARHLGQEASQGNVSAQCGNGRPQEGH